MPDKETMSTIMNTYGINANLVSGSSGASGGGGFSVWTILAGIIFGIIGMYAFNTGRKEKNYRPIVIGITLIAFPYFIYNIWLVILIGCALTAALFYWRD